MPPSAGRIFVRDQEIDASHFSVGAAHALSIETVYQDKSLGEKSSRCGAIFFVGRQITRSLGASSGCASRSASPGTSC